ncbi:glutamine amidotransferase [Neisseriaceae bacterium JH1-16]|nr:glutamine amidotransferase [Neisseriaceae bacterium JH1-16]
MKHALILRHQLFEHAGSLAAVLATRGFTVEYVEAPLAELSGLDVVSPDLLVLLGGPVGVYESDRYPFLAEELSLAEQRIAAQKPVIGICLGAQILASALGAQVVPGRGKEIGWLPIDYAHEAASTPLRLLAEAPQLLHWHGDVFTLPAGARSLASTALTPHQIFDYRGFALGFQCHPEVLAEEFEAWLVGNALEIAQEGLDPVVLREEARQFGPALQAAASRCFAHWLAERGL